MELIPKANLIKIVCWKWYLDLEPYTVSLCLSYVNILYAARNSIET